MDIKNKFFKMFLEIQVDDHEFFRYWNVLQKCALIIPFFNESITILDEL